MKYQILIGDVLDQLATMSDQSVQCIVTSPPYWGLRDYGVEGQIGLEPTLQEWLDKMVAVFAECKRVLRDDGTFWLNIGDSYASSGSRDAQHKERPELNGCASWGKRDNTAHPKTAIDGLKPKDLIGQPWRLAFALQADGWYLRSDIIWAKPNPMPESVTDRPTKSHEHIFLLTKKAKYFYDADAVREPGGDKGWNNSSFTSAQDIATKPGLGMSERSERPGRNIRDVWTIPTQSFPEAHFATFPEEIPKRCILAGTKAGDTVLDPFSGSGTTGLVALKLGRKYIGIELNPEYAEMSIRRIDKVARQELLL